MTDSARTVGLPDTVEVQKNQRLTVLTLSVQQRTCKHQCPLECRQEASAPLQRHQMGRCRQLRDSRAAGGTGQV